MFDMSDATTTEYEATGATFVSSVDNTTALTIGTGDTLDVEFTLKASNLYTDAFDMGAYVLVEAPVTDYDVDTMSVSFDGQALTAVDLSGKESTAYNAYEKVYKIPANLASEILGGSGTGKKLRVTIDALSDVNADDDVVVALASIGSVQEINSNNLRYSSVSDASSPSAVYTLQSFTIDIQ
jgi:ribose 5-phosphate isomerase